MQEPTKYLNVVPIVKYRPFYGNVRYVKILGRATVGAAGRVKKNNLLAFFFFLLLVAVIRIIG